jgi:F-type H+-transporting ATPase subunit c
MLALALGLGLPIAAFGGALAQGRAASSALEGIARQPEAAGRIQTAMIIALALIESLVIYALLAFFLLNGKVPAVTAAEAVAMSQGGAATGTVR